MVVSRQATQEINKEVGDIVMMRVFNFRVIVELINNRSAMEQDAICHDYELIFHVVAQPGDERDIIAIT